MQESIRQATLLAIPVLLMFMGVRNWHAQKGLAGRELLETTLQTMGGQYLASLLMQQPLKSLVSSFAVFLPVAVVVPNKWNYSKYVSKLALLKKNVGVTARTLRTMEDAVQTTIKYVMQEVSGFILGRDSKIMHNFAYLDYCFDVLFSVETECKLDTRAAVEELEQIIVAYDDEFKKHLRKRVLKPFLGGCSNALWLHGPRGVGKTRFATELARATQSKLVTAGFALKNEHSSGPYDARRDWVSFEPKHASFYACVAAGARGNKCVALVDEADKSLAHHPKQIADVLRTLQGNQTIWDEYLGIDVPTTHTCVVFTANVKPTEVEAASDYEKFAKGELDALASRVVCVPFPEFSKETKRAVLEKKFGTLSETTEELLQADTSPGIRELLQSVEAMVTVERSYTATFKGTKWE